MTRKNSSSVLCVLDTNVILTADGQQGDVSSECVDKCIKIVNEVTRGKRRLVVDEGNEIGLEYKKNLLDKYKSRHDSDSDIGAEFIKWFFDFRYQSKYIVEVPITKTGYTYAEFPKDEGLKALDPSDHKFIAVACAHSAKPYIMQATDSKWWGFRDVFKRLGICICFLCEDYVKRKYHEKQRQR